MASGLVCQCGGRRATSLFVPFSKRQHIPSLLFPHINTELLLNQTDRLQTILNLRRMDVDAKQLARDWIKMCDYQTQRDQLQELQEQTNKEIHLLNKTVKLDNAQMSALKEKGRMLRTQMDSLQAEFSIVEESTMERALRIPNILHPDTPTDEDRVIETVRHPRTQHIPIKSHKEIGREYDEIHSHGVYYLGRLGSLVELAVIKHVSSRLEEFHFERLSTPDFSKCIVMDGCGIKLCGLNTVGTWKADNTDIILVGGASLPAFCSLHMRSWVDVAHLPLRYYTAGRKYSHNMDFNQFGLYLNPQATHVHFMMATKDEASLFSCYKSYTDMLCALYAELGITFRKVAIGAASLSPAESLRLELQTWSPYYTRHFPVATISMSNDWISQRLIMQYRNKENGQLIRKPLHLLHGCVVCCSTLIAHLMEMNQCWNEACLPPILLPYLDQAQ